MNKIFIMSFMSFIAFSLSISMVLAQSSSENIQKLNKAKEKLSVLKDKLKEKLSKSNSKIKATIRKGLPKKFGIINKANKGNPVFTGKSQSQTGRK